LLKQQFALVESRRSNTIKRKLTETTTR